MKQCRTRHSSSAGILSSHCQTPCFPVADAYCTHSVYSGNPDTCIYSTYSTYTQHTNTENVLIFRFSQVFTHLALKGQKKNKMQLLDRGNVGFFVHMNVTEEETDESLLAT